MRCVQLFFENAWFFGSKKFFVFFGTNAVIIDVNRLVCPKGCPKAVPEIVELDNAGVLSSGRSEMFVASNATR